MCVYIVVFICSVVKCNWQGIRKNEVYWFISTVMITKISPKAIDKDVMLQLITVYFAAEFM